MPKLTVASIEKHRAHKVRREIADAACPGLYLVVQPSGIKSFALRYRNPFGRSIKLTLGRLDITGIESSTAPMIGMPLTLVAARHLAMQIHRQRILGNDVVADRRLRRLEEKAGQSKTFAQAALDYTEQHLKRSVRRWQEGARLLGVDVGTDGALTVAPKGLADRWRDRPLEGITADDIHAVIDEVRERGVPGRERRADGPSEAMAKVMHTRLSSMFGWLLQKRRISANPMRDVAKVKKSSEARERVLTDDELKAFWHACDKLDQPVAQCLKLLVLTGCRREEIGQLRHAERTDNTITIPASRSKNGKPHVIPLPPLAREILASVETSGDFVFASKRGKPIAAWSRIKKQLDSALQFSTPFVIHDLRRTFSTGLSRIGIAPEVVEATINHISGTKAGVAGVYNQYQYLPEKAAALARWADHVAGIVAGHAKVVPIRQVAA